jgi:chromate transporter
MLSKGVSDRQALDSGEATMNADLRENQEAHRSVSKRELFVGFLKIGLLGFGGIAPWARHVIIEERRWLTDKEFAAILGIGQILPGPNTMNASVMIGDRFQGVGGVLACLLGQMAMPLVIVTSLAVVYQRFAEVPEVKAALVGAAAGAAGLVLGTALKMVRKIKLKPLALLVATMAVAAIGLLAWPLVPVVLVLVPLGVTAAALERRA